MDNIYITINQGNTMNATNHTTISMSLCHDNMTVTIRHDNWSLREVAVYLLINYTN